MNLASHFPGFLIAIEGIDGTGKTTQANLLGEKLAAQGLKVLRTKEPTAGQWGQVLRDSALTGRLSIADEVETFIKDRKEHVETRIMPHLRDGFVVIVDRYYFSTAAYQGARGLDPGELMRRNEEFAPQPDLLVLLDLDVSAGLARVHNRGDRANHFEQTDTLGRAREIFLKINKPYLYKLDARQDPQTISTAILREFAIRYAECFAKSGREIPRELRETFRVFGAPLLA